MFAKLWHRLTGAHDAQQEMDADFDALATESDEAAKRAIRASKEQDACRMIAQAKYGPLRDGREV